MKSLSERLPCLWKASCLKDYRVCEKLLVWKVTVLVRSFLSERLPCLWEASCLKGYRACEKLLVWKFTVFLRSFLSKRLPCLWRASLLEVYRVVKSLFLSGSLPCLWIASCLVSGNFCILCRHPLRPSLKFKRCIFISLDLSHFLKTYR